MGAETRFLRKKRVSDRRKPRQRHKNRVFKKKPDFETRVGDTPERLHPYKWFYVRWHLDGLEPWNNCIVVVVAFRPASARFVVTSYQDYIREQ